MMMKVAKAALKVDKDPHPAKTEATKEKAGRTKIRLRPGGRTDILRTIGAARGVGTGRGTGLTMQHERLHRRSVANMASPFRVSALNDLADEVAVHDRSGNTHLGGPVIISADGSGPVAR